MPSTTTLLRRVVLPVATIPLPPLALDLPLAPRDPDALARFAAEHELGTPIGRVQQAVVF